MTIGIRDGQGSSAGSAVTIRSIRHAHPVRTEEVAFDIDDRPGSSAYDLTANLLAKAKEVALAQGVISADKDITTCIF